MFKSLRWTLLCWYAVILAAVIAGFGAALYWNVAHAQRQELDAELRAHQRTLLASIAGDEAETPQVSISEAYRRQFNPQGKHASYFAIWDQAGNRLAASRDDLDLPPPDRTQPPGRPDRPWPSDRGLYHELNLLGPSGTIITVGQRVDEDQRRMRQLLGMIAAVGWVSWLGALAGGWLLAGRMLVPIERMSRTAAAISAGDLDQRIDVAQTENELGRLAAVLNAAFDRLEAAYEQQARFTADASHELRTPLAVLLANASLMLRRDRTPEEYREALQTTLDAGQRMQDVVEGMLTLARAAAPQRGRPSRSIDLQALVQDTCTLFAPLAEERQVRLEAQLEPVVLTGHEDDLRQIVNNLLSNAIRYNRPGGSVEVRLGNHANEAVLSVADTGIGIPAADVPHIFERFYRVDKARARSQGGSGLGLAIVQALVAGLGGTIACTSQEGEGTTFVVRVPILQAVAPETDHRPVVADLCN